jgi:transposase
MKKKQATIRAAVLSDRSVTPLYDTLKLGIDWHAREYRVVRIIDNAGPEPAQRFRPDEFLIWVRKQLTLARRVISCYEAGAGGFVLHRQLTELKVTNHVVHPRKLDRDHPGVQNDKLDARELALDLDRFVRGNPKALRRVHVPTPAQEQRRQQSRQRQQLVAQRLRLAAQGRSLLLSQGWPESNHWWKAVRWEALLPQLPGWLAEALAVFRRLIASVNAELTPLRQAVAVAAPALRPKGLGALTLEEIQREVCDWERFPNRKAVGSYAGLVGGVSATGAHACDLAITKAGNVRLRTLLIEAAWRWVVYQSQSRLVQRWRAILLNPRAHKRARKRAIVAVARALLVDLWRWQTGRQHPEDLSWVMVDTAAPA